MSKSFKKKMLILMLFMGCLMVLMLFTFLRYQGVLGIYMRLNGDKHIEIEINEPYEEKGIEIRKNFHTITQNIKIQSNVNIEKLGMYEVTYTFEKHQEIRYVKIVDTVAPIMHLNGEAQQIIFQNDPYEEAGVEVVDNSNQVLKDQVEIIHQVDTSLLGEYKVQYRVMDEAGNTTTLERIVKIVENPMSTTLYYHYDELDNQKLGWWFKKANDHERKASTYDATLMEQYDAYYLGKDEKVIYLTFDEGGNDTTYIKEITNILNNHDVQATYFLTRNYILDEADFMRELVNEGHEIGNHTRTHPDMTSLANVQGCEKFVKEIMETQKAIYEVTKQLPPFIFRFPKGDFSQRSLAMVKDLGYRTYFWSHAYNDYGEAVSKEEAYNNLVSHLHQGAIYLLHPANRGNYQAMEEFILEAKRQGYAFELVSKIKKV